VRAGWQVLAAVPEDFPMFAFFQTQQVLSIACW
jgi:hypothetical protein